MQINTSFIEPFLQSPIASIILLVSVVISLFALRDESLKRKLVLIPYRFVHDKDYKTIITSGLIHVNFIHLAMNAVALYYIGIGSLMYSGLERSMIRYQILMNDTVLQRGLAHTKFLLIYLIAMVFADIPTILKHKDNPTYSTAGASGAISGIMIAHIFFSWDQGIIIWGMPGWVFALVYLGASFFLGLRGGGRVNHDAHFWGGIVGLVLIIMFYPEKAMGYFDQIMQWIG